MQGLITKLNEYLADLNVFYRKLQNYHWNIEGRDFFVLHSKLEEYYNEINEQIDEVGEFILGIGGEPLGTLRDYLNVTKITEAQNKKVKSNVVYTEIIKDFSHLLDCVNGIKQKSDEIGNSLTSAFVDDFIKEYTKILWMLKQTNT